MKVTEVEAKSALHKLKKRGVPYSYDLNIYRGCQHGCRYCYAMKSHGYLGKSEFTQDIMVKTNIAEVLDKELSTDIWNGEPINLGGVCDSYQPLEKKYEIMRDVLKVLIKHKVPTVICTKSDLIKRDLDLFDELANCTNVRLAVSMTSDNDALSKNLEPGASLPKERFIALKEAGLTKATTGMLMMPIIPILADSKATLENLVRYAKEANVDYMVTGMLYLSGGIKKRYYDFLMHYYPYTLVSYEKLYEKGSANKDYKSEIHTMLKEIRKEYGV